jgi:hypothetical protein
MDMSKTIGHFPAIDVLIKATPKEDVNQRQHILYIKRRTLYQES